MRAILTLKIEIQDMNDPDLLDPNIMDWKKDYLSIVGSGPGGDGFLFLGHGKVASLQVKPSQVAGFVYFIKSSAGIKIGRTKNLEKRTSQIIASLPLESELIGAIQTDDMVSLEKQFHAHYAQDRVRGEWFDLCPKHIMAVIDMSPLRPWEMRL